MSSYKIILSPTCWLQTTKGLQLRSKPKNNNCGMKRRRKWFVIFFRGGHLRMIVLSERGKKNTTLHKKNRFLEEENFSRHFSRISTQLIECDEILKINFYKRMWWWIGNGNSRQNFFLYEFIIDWEPLRQKMSSENKNFLLPFRDHFFSPIWPNIDLYLPFK